MKEVSPIELRFTGKSANWKTNFLDLSAFEKVEIFLRLVAKSAAGTVAIGAIEATPTTADGVPLASETDNPQTKCVALDVAKYTVEGAFPAALSNTDDVSKVTLLHPGMWTRIALTYGGTGTIDATLYILGKD